MTAARTLAVGSERGGGTVLTMGLAGALLCITWAAAVLVAWLGAARAAQSAADLAALAGASAWAEGSDACAAARSAAHRNQATAVDCTVRGDRHAFVVDVTAVTPLLPRVPGLPDEVRRSATAGSG